MHHHVPAGLIAGKTADHLGRNRAIAVACLIFLVGSSCMTLATSYNSMLLGRLITVSLVVASVHTTQTCGGLNTRPRVHLSGSVRSGAVLKCSRRCPTTHSLRPHTNERSITRAESRLRHAV
jgi:hypothetical protein